MNRAAQSPNEFSGDARHSAEYFGESRDYWWNEDFLALTLRRWSVEKVVSLLDVGCGVGHWGQTWARALLPEARVIGVDREPAWVEKASKRASRAGLGKRCHYQVALAEALPFPADSFDFVTCQTLLIHVQDARAVLSELIRVTRPGGIVVVAEPNNAAVPVIEDGLAAGLSSDELSRLVRFNLVCLRGKASLGLGDDTIGRLLPRLFKEAGLEQISVCLNEKACPLVPPYSSARERAIVAEVTDWARRDFWIWNRADTARYFAAGGGDEREFEVLWALAMSLWRRVAERMMANEYSCAGGGLFYLVAGRKSVPAD